MTSIKVFVFVLASIVGFHLHVSAQKKLKASQFKHKVNLMMNMQLIPMSSNKTIEEKDGRWVISQTLTSSMGEMKDEFTISKDDLSPISKKLSEGSASVNVSYTNEEVRGSIEVNGTNHKIEHNPKHALFADGSAIFESLTNLPLKVGYETIYHIYDIQAQSERAYTIKVLAEESVEVEAGEFKTLKCQITPADEAEFTTLFSGAAEVWLSMEEGTASLIKYNSDIPNGGMIEIELSK